MRNDLATTISSVVKNIWASVLFALRDVMRFPWGGVGERVRWSVYATVEGEPFVFELRKFGFAIDHRDGAAP